MEIMNQALARTILRDEFLKMKAEIFEDSTSNPFEVQVIDLTLTTARTPENPYRVGFPFKSVFVREATDGTVSVDLRPTTNDSFQSPVKLKLNDSLIMGRPVSEAFLSWSAQAGKTIQLVFFVTSEFRSGSQVSQNAGGVSISDGTAFVNAQLTLVAATALSVFASDSTRKKGTLQNTTGASIWVGASTVTNSGATIGIEVPSGGIFYWSNTAQLYAYSVGGGLVTTMSET